MSLLTQDDLDAAAHSLNGRPRQTLDWMTPSEKLAEVLQWPLELAAVMCGVARGGAVRRQVGPFEGVFAKRVVPLQFLL